MGRFADGWIADDRDYERWVRLGASRYTVQSHMGESTMTTRGRAPSSLERWLQSGVGDVGDGLEAQIHLSSRLSLEEVDLASDEAVHAADRKVLVGFLAEELTTDFEGELAGDFKFCRRAEEYQHYWFFNIDKIVLGEYPLEKVPEHLRDIVKEARGIID